MPTSLRISRRFFLVSSRGMPSTTMVPLSMSSRPLRQRRNVDLPEPEGPMTTTTSPLWMRVEKFTRALTPLGKVLLIPSTSMM